MKRAEERPGRRVEYMPVDAIGRATRNPKRHADGIGVSISRFGLADLPVLDERTGRLVSGHGRLDHLIARQEAGDQPPDGVRVGPGGEWLMPVVRGWASRSDPDADAYVLAANQLTIAGGWDDAQLGDLLAELAEADAELFAATGFTDDDLAALLAAAADGSDGGGGTAGLADPDDVPEPPRDPITQPGDLWLLGPHRIIAGDCRDWATVERLLDGARVNVAFTSPPYASQRAYDETSGFKPIPPDQYVDWFEDVQANIRAVLAEDGSWFVNIKEHCEDGQRHLYVKDLTIAHVRRWAWRFVDELCWVDATNGFPGAFPNRFKNAWEPVFHFAAAPDIRFRPLANGHASDDILRYDPAAHMDMGDQGYTVEGERRYEQGTARPSNVLRIASGGEGTHSAAFPAALPAWFIRAYSDPGDVVFDPFMGSGTALIAAHGEGRVGYGCEISPAYTDVICRRWQRHTGSVPVLAATGRPVDFTGEQP